MGIGGGVSMSSSGIGSAATKSGVSGSALSGADRDFVSSGEGDLAVTGSADWGRSAELSLEFFVVEISVSVHGSGDTTSRVTVSALGARVTL
jgi:hypothetical protein